MASICQPTQYCHHSKQSHKAVFMLNTLSKTGESSELAKTSGATGKSRAWLWLFINNGHLAKSCAFFWHPCSDFLEKVILSVVATASFGFHKCSGLRGDSSQNMQRLPG